MFLRLVHRWALASQLPWSFFRFWFICRCLYCCPSLDPGLAEVWLPSFHHCMLGPWFCIFSYTLCMSVWDLSVRTFLFIYASLLPHLLSFLCTGMHCPCVLRKVSSEINHLSLGPFAGQVSWASHSPLSCKAVILLFVLHTTQYLKLHHLLGTAAKIASSLQLPDEFFLVRQWQVQQSAFPSWLIDHSHEEIVRYVPEISWTACSQPCCLSTRSQGG